MPLLSSPAPIPTYRRLIFSSAVAVATRNVLREGTQTSFPHYNEVSALLAAPE